jgi:hypothetical protein
MGLTGNFGRPQLDGEVLTVSGTSSGLDDCELVARNFVVHQDGAEPVHGPAPPGQKWTAEALPAPGFVGGGEDALAVGVETYLVNKNVEDAPTFMTFTWSQIVKIEGK